MITIRPAVPDDAFQMTGLGRVELSALYPAGDSNVALGILATAIARGGGFVAEAGLTYGDEALTYGGEAVPQMVGFAVFALGASPWAPGKVIAEELMLYVAPEQRRSGCARKLMRHGIMWARGKGATAVRATAQAGSPVGALYDDLGFAPQETVYLKGL